MASEWVANDSDWTTDDDAADSAGYTSRYAVRIAGYAGQDASAEERTFQAALLRCVFGNPFQPLPKVSPSWQTPSALAIAQQFYESEDAQLMPVLADALQQGGCTDANILAHCLGPVEHVKGCWVVELLTGRGEATPAG